MPSEEYGKAYKQGKKNYRAALLRGEAPYLPALEPMLEGKKIEGQQELGVVDVPLDLIAGTYYSGRQPTFGRDFLPLMPESSEFSQKWSTLCKAHTQDGIRDPIEACEYKGRFYVIEGHKRVSVLKFFGAWSVRGHVTRVLTSPEDTAEDRIYREYLKFYSVTGINFLWFTREGGYKALLKYAGTSPDAKWDDYERTDFRAFYAKFSQVFEEKAPPSLNLTPGDAMLIYLGVYDYASSVNKTLSELRTELSRVWSEVKNSATGDAINLVLKPDDTKRPLLTRHEGLRVAFIHSGTEESSSWVYSHELGRRDLEAAFKGRIETICLDMADTDEAAEDAIKAAVADSSDLIFTTSPQLLGPSVKAALANPKLRILNCSLNTTHPSVRTYHARLYEAKFLMGMIAGSLSKDDLIGYVADYPIYGITANINAFALGAKMVNPRARVRLEWSKTADGDGRERLLGSGIEYISDREMISPDGSSSHRVGLYHHSNSQPLVNIALSVCHWGRMYTKIVSNYLSRGWKSSSDTRAINYWWGMESGVTDLICSRSLPEGTARLISLLGDSIRTGAFQPFSGRIATQSGEILDFTQRAITPVELITMDWLADNVDGIIPEYSQLLPDAQALVKLQGLKQS